MPRRPSAAEPTDETGEFPLHPEIYFIHLAVAISRHREAQLDAELRPLGLDLAGFRALRVVLRFGSATMGELADFTMVDRTTLTRVVDSLVEGGLMVRSKPAGDRRKVMLNLTPHGRKVLETARKVVSDNVFQLMDGLPEADVRAAVRLQQKVVQRLGVSEQLTTRLLWLPPEKRARARRTAPPAELTPPPAAPPTGGRRGRSG